MNGTANAVFRPDFTDYTAPQNRLAPQPTWADAATYNTQAVSDYITQQRAKSEQMGLWDPNTGLPTGAGVVNAAQQTAQGILMGTTAPGIRAFHASPHDFERFDTSKIGTGQGAQSFGHGLYTAESPAVSGGGGQYDLEFTAKNLGKGDLNQQESSILMGLRAGKSDLDLLREQAGMGASFEEAQAAIDKVKAAKANIYEVNIGADPEQFLHWDKPLSEQSPQVQTALGKLGIQPPGASYSVRPVEGGHVVDYQDANNQWTTSRVYKSADDAKRQADITMKMMDRDPTGGQVYESSKLVPGNYRDSAAAAQALRDAGIPGIRYLDQGSRGAGEGTHNYVVFDAATIDILRKYGLAGLGIGLGTAAAGTQQQSQ